MHDLSLDSGSAFNRETAITMARLSRDAYLAYDQFRRTWERQGEVQGWDMGGTVARVVLGPSDALVTFRGSDDLHDWIHNLDAHLTPAEFPSELAAKVRVHHGFMEALDEVFLPLVMALEEHDSSRIWLTGHSLGGALAAITAVSLDLLILPVEAVYSFGAPRPGNRALARVGRGVPHYRVAASGDPVPHLPPWLLGFRHHGSLRHLTPTGAITRTPSLVAALRSLVRDRVVGAAGLHSMDRYLNLLRRPQMSERERERRSYKVDVTIDPESRGGGFDQVTEELEDLGVSIPEGDRPVTLHGTPEFRAIVEEAATNE